MSIPASNVKEVRNTRPLRQLQAIHQEASGTPHPCFSSGEIEGFKPAVKELRARLETGQTPITFRKANFDPQAAQQTFSQTGTSVISKSVRETNDALAEKAEQSGPLFEIPGGLNRQLFGIIHLAQNSENNEINNNICKYSTEARCENQVLSG